MCSEARANRWPDPWIKAAHFDPDRHGTAQPGWWTYPNASESPLVPGPPGMAQTTAGWRPTPLESEWLVPLGAYPEVVSPFGLLDASGGVTEWTEEVFRFFDSWPPIYRGTDGAWAGAQNADVSDLVYDGGTAIPPGSKHTTIGLRVASAFTIPLPGTGTVLFVSVVLSTRHRKRHT